MRMKKFNSIVLLLIIFINSQAQSNQPLFELLSPKKTKVDFQNSVIENDSLNYFYFDNLYNGAGVATGDINNDGLADIYFTSNLGYDQLYINLGNMKFKNITKKAFPQQDHSGWHTAVSFADVNADGWLDIYVCKHGLGQTEKVNFRNLLYINNRDNTFTEKAKEYGIDDPGRSMDADFLDYDMDGDLDLFVTNHRENLSIMDIYNKIPYTELFHSNRLYRNDGDKFTEVTKASGLLSFGFCLASSVGDLNNDGWPDIYVASDYDTPDFMFINQQNGKFKNEVRDRVRHTSQYSMGIDIADFNNDLAADLFVLDMSNKDYAKSKTNMGAMNVATFWDNVAKGYHHQYMYNMLQLNLGTGYFSEIAQLSGIASTDWSWAPLVADFDQDGWKDLFVTNGYLREVRNKDFTSTLKDYMATKPNPFNCMDMLSKIPQSHEINYAYKNKGDLTFQDVSTEWGITMGSNSHGAAYADLDNDGDLDLVITAINEPVQILENKLNENKYLKISLKGSVNNPFAYGAKVIVHTDQSNLMQELYPSRGYASSCEPVLIFGLGDATEIRSVEIIWNATEQTTLGSLEINSTLLVDYSQSRIETPSPLFNLPSSSKQFSKFSEIPFDDFATEVLLPHKMSELGPFMSAGDIIGDGLSDFYVGGTRDKAGKLYMQTSSGFDEIQQDAFAKDSMFEDAGSVFFDADSDGDQDLYVVSGGNEYKAYSPFYQDRLYLNNGKGIFTRDINALPEINASGQKVVTHDIDKDGDQDLIVLGRQVPGFYLLKPESYILLNDKGKFTNKTKEIAPELQFAGMITDGTFSDFDADGDDDLIIVGEWMKPLCFENQNGKFVQTEKINSCEKLFGWWNCITAVDINSDGIHEYVLGNVGLNNKFHPSAEFPLSARLEDFDKNGTHDLVLTKYFGGVLHPVRGRGCLSDQIPEIKQRFQTYEAFATTPVDQIFNFTTDPEIATEFASGILMWNDGKLDFIPFSNFAQIGPINKIIPLHLNHDPYLDFMAFGNKYEAEIETPRYDGNPGMVFLNDGGTGNFDIYPLEQNGPFVNRNAKDALLVGNLILVSNSSEGVYQLEYFW
ncbi:MAG: VCBS repeat-containing protein [Crocinitomicaceae bacterium]|nr:VCBS repeat-containing protein [Crocinitomicaceae bacterium]